MMCESSNKHIATVEQPNRKQTFYWDGKSPKSMVVEEAQGGREIFALSVARVVEFIEYCKNRDLVSIEVNDALMSELKGYLPYLEALAEQESD